jgi:SAM-dependent methyltransferase
VTRFYEGDGSLFVDAYDALYSDPPPQIAGDIGFYESLARTTGGPVLELACGTGRIALALATAGFDVVGIDSSEGMLSIARRKVAELPAEARDRVTLIHQDMSELNVARCFGFVFVPFRSFQHLLTIELQVKCLKSIRPHLEASGRLALHLFDPRLDLLTGGSGPALKLSGTHPASGRRYVGEVLETRLDHVAQVRTDLWRYAEVDPAGKIVAQDTRAMSLRWTYRWELYHLLKLCGFAVESEQSDFAGAGPSYGKELIVVAQRA